MKTLKTSCDMQLNGVRLTLSAFVYWVWRSRNDKNFNGRPMTVQALVHYVKNDVRTKLMSLSFEIPMGPVKNEMEQRWSLTIQTNNRLVKHVSWTKPVWAMVKTNFDGRVVGETGYWAATVRGSVGEI